MYYTEKGILMIKKDKRDRKEISKKMKYCLIALILSVLIVSFVILLSEKSRLKTIDDYSRVISQIATIIGVFGVFYALKSFKKSEEDSKQKEYSELMKNSIKVLDIFSSKLIPMMVSFEDESQKRYKEVEKMFLVKAQRENVEIDTLPDELKERIDEIAKTDSKIYKIFNSIEQVCAYISYDLILEDVVYPTTHKVLLEFLAENKSLLNKMTTVDAPYTNLHDVKMKWNKIAKKESIERKQKKIDEEKKEANLG